VLPDKPSYRDSSLSLTGDVSRVRLTAVRVPRAESDRSLLTPAPQRTMGAR
jgi:hypothetical protein